MDSILGTIIEPDIEADIGIISVGVIILEEEEEEEEDIINVGDTNGL